MRTDGVTTRIDHAVVMLDGRAYRAVLDSEFLRGFGTVRAKESQSSLAGRYTGAAVIGHSTLVELFDVSAPPLPGVTGGLVLSLEEPGSSEVARALLRAAGVDYTHELVRRAVDGEDRMRPWYHLVRPDLGPDNPFLLMINEVTEDYYRFIGAVPGPAGELTRRGYLAARLSAGPAPEQRMVDVTEVTLRLRPERAERLDAVLTALGYAPGPELTVSVEHGEPEGVLSVGMTVTPGVDAEERFGDTSALVLRDGSACWRFMPTRG